MRKIALSLTDSVDLRVILSVLYVITEVIRTEISSESDEYCKLCEDFVQEISKRYISFISWHK